MVNTSVGLTFRLAESAVRNFNRIDTAITRVEKAAEKGEGELRRFNTTLTATGVAAGIAIGATAKSAASLEDALARLETVTRTTSNTVITALGNAEQAARDFSTEFSASASDIIRAQFQIATAGIAVEEQIAAVQGAFKLARATVGDFTQSAQLLGQFLNTFGKSAQLNFLDPVSKVTRLTDVLASTVQRFQVTLPVLAEGFKFIVGPARQLNLQYEEMNAALGILNTAGFRGTLAGTALSNTFNKLDRAIEKLDLDPSKFIDLEGNLKSLAAFFRALNEALADKTAIEGQNKLIEILDIRAGRVAKTLADNVEQLARTSAEFEILQGATDRMNKVVESTTSKSFKQLLNTLVNIGTSIGKVINAGLTPLIGALTEVLKVIADFIERNRGSVAVILIVTTAILLQKAAVFAWTAVTTLATKISAAFTAKQAAQGAAVAAATTQINASTVAMGRFGVVGAIGSKIVGGLVIAIKAIGVALLRIIPIVLIISVAIQALNVVWALFVRSAELFTNIFPGATALFKEIKKGQLDLISSTRQVAVEFERLGKALQFGAQAPIGAQLQGITSLTDEVNKGLAEGLKLDEAVREASKRLGGETGIIRDAAQKILGSDAISTEIDKFADEFKTAFDLIQVFDPQATKVKFDVEGGPEVAKVIKLLGDGPKVAKLFAIAGEEALTAIVGGSKEAATEVTKLNKNIRQLESAINVGATEPANKLRIVIAQQLIRQMDTLKKVDAFVPIIQQLEELGFTADSADADIEQFAKSLNKASFGVKEFLFPLILAETILNDTFSAKNAKLIDNVAVVSKKLGKELSSVIGPAGVVKTTFNQLDGAFNRIKVGGTRIERIFKRIEEGNAGVAESAEGLNKAFREQHENIATLIQLQGVLPGLIKKLENSFGDLNEAEKKVLEVLQKRVKELPDNIEDSIDSVKKAARRNIGLQEFFNLTGFDVGSRIGKIIQAGSGSISSILENVISGGIERGVAVAEINNALRRLFLRPVVDALGKAFLAAFADDISKLEQSISDKAPSISATIKKALATGGREAAVAVASDFAIKLTSQFSDLGVIAQEITPKLSEVEKQINKIAVAGITATTAQASALNDLQRILSQPITTTAELDKQNARLTEFIKLQNQTGGAGGTAIKEASDALLRNLNNVSGGQLDTITRAQSAAQSTIQKLDTTVSNTLATATNAATSIASALTPVFETFKQSVDKLELITGVGSGAGSRTLEALVEIQSTQTNFEINIQGGGAADISSFLEEDEIREIVDEVRTKLRQEMDAKLRQLEERLKGR